MVNFVSDDGIGGVTFVVQFKYLLNSIGVVLLDYIAIGINGCTIINNTEHFNILNFWNVKLQKSLYKSV